MGDNTEMGTLAVTEELHAKQQEAARKEAERAARKAPQDAAADAKGEAGERASKKGSTARSSRPPGRPAIGGSLGRPMLYSSGTTGRPKGIVRSLPEQPPSKPLPISDLDDSL
jgi:long-chain acyl-CoA synthetase